MKITVREAFNLKNHPRYEVSTRVYVPSGFTTGSQKWKASEADIQKAIGNLDEPDAIAQAILELVRRTEGRNGDGTPAKWVVDTIRVLDPSRISIRYQNTSPSANYFTNKYALGVVIKDLAG